MSDIKTVLIVDDHPFFREGLKSLVARHPRLKLIGEAGSATEGLQKARELRPDLVLMDISLPDDSGFEASRNICSLLPETRVVILTMHSTVDYVSKAFAAGATGYVSKESAPEQLLECLDLVCEGEYFIDPALSRRIVEGLAKARKKEGTTTDLGYNTLTPREQEVMRLLAEGLSTKKIAEKLFISRKTVENHRSSIMKKLNLRSATELIRYAAKFGIIDVADWLK